MSNKITFTPLGGVGQIGSNMALLETKESRFIIDTGILFPFEDFFDINYLIPDMKQIGNVDALIITHGHEDHIGAIVHFKEQFPKVPIHSPLFASKLMEKKLKERGLGCKFNIYQPFEKIHLKDDVVVTPIPVNHSIPDTYGLLITHEKSDSSLLYVSDFKVDDKNDPNLKKASSLFKKYKNKVALFDSTNITSSQDKTFSESELYSDLKNAAKESEGRLFITSFASNVERTQAINKICKELKRPMVMIGRSMKFYTQTAISLGYLEEFAKIHFDFGEVSNESNKLVCMVSGCQGDFKSATRRIINGEDGLISLNESDTFMFSSKTIPGNEKKIGMLENKLSEGGCRILKPGKLKIHASGHAGREDLKIMYELFRPNFIVPIHGESTFIDAHINFAQSVIPDSRQYKVLNYSSITFHESGEAKLSERKAHDPIIIHGRGIELERSAISKRRKMACNGVILISANLKNQKFKMELLGTPDLLERKRDDISSIIESHLKSCSGNGDEELRIKIRRICQEFLGYKPVTLVHFL